MRKAKDSIIMVIQICMVPIFKTYSWILGVKGIRIKGLEKIGRGSLIIANHQSKLDPFMILAQFPFRTFCRTIPIRFPVAHKEYTRYKCLRIFGAYDIGETNREKMLGLYKTRQYLADGYSIMIFPEGKLSKSDELGELKMGVSFLVSHAKSVLFVKIAGFNIKKDRLVSFSDIMKINGEKVDESFLRNQLAGL